MSGFPLACLNSAMPCVHLHSRREPWGLPEFYDVSLPACHGLWTPADLRTLANPGASVSPSVYVKTLGIRNTLISKLYQHFRVHVTPMAYRILCLRLTCFVRDSALRHRSKTRYGWVASPFPMGTFTPQDTPSFARRDNVALQPTSKSAAF